MDELIVSALEKKEDSIKKVFFPNHNDESVPFVEGYIYVVKGVKKKRRSRKRKSTRCDWTYWGKQFGSKNIYIF